MWRRNSRIRKGNWVERKQTNAAKPGEKKSTTEVGNLGPDPEEREKYETRFCFALHHFPPPSERKRDVTK